MASPIPAADRSATSTGATFHYVDAALANTEPSFAGRASFETRFHQELESVGTWLAKAQWKTKAMRDLQVFISAEYKISKALVFAWNGRPGHMEFPAWRVAAGKAAIAHELAHVFLPNGNRLLAEGLAVCLQSSIGGNPAFPNFGRPLNELARDHLEEMAPEFSHGGLFEQVHLADLDRIATPSPLTLTVGTEFYGEEPRGQARIYSIAGSFVQYLLETRGMDKFYALYLQTPLVPLARNAGTLDRWMKVYGVSLAELEREWKSAISRRPLKHWSSHYGATATGDERCLKSNPR